MPDDYLQYCIYLLCWNILAVKSKRLFHHKELPKLSVASLSTKFHP